MGVESKSETNKEAFSWKNSTPFKFFATIQDTRALPRDMNAFGSWRSTAIHEERVTLLGFVTATARDAFVAATKAIPFD